MTTWLIVYSDRWGRIHECRVHSEITRVIARNWIDRTNPPLSFIAQYQVEESN